MTYPFTFEIEALPNQCPSCPGDLLDARNTPQPYKVEGQPRTSQQIIDSDDAGRSARYAEGRTFDLSATAFLCRCGHSGSVPFCDGPHKTADVALDETAMRASLLAGAQEIDGPRLTLTDNELY